MAITYIGDPIFWSTPPNEAISRPVESDYWRTEPADDLCDEIENDGFNLGIDAAIAHVERMGLRLVARELADIKKRKGKKGGC